MAQKLEEEVLITSRLSSRKGSGKKGTEEMHNKERREKQRKMEASLW